MRREFLVLLACCWMLAIVSSARCADSWGDLSGQIIFDGPAPVPEKAKITSDQEVCCQHDVVNESLLVDPKTKGIKNVIVVLTRGRTDKRELPIHESYEALKEKPVEMDNRGCRFDPHVTLIWTARKVVIANTDPIGHNVNLTSGDSDQFNETIPSGSTIEKTFSTSKRIPVGISCSIHPWMKGWAVIRDHPYMAVTGDDGNFEIKNLPVGKWEFMFWQEAAGYVSEVQRDGKSEKWRRGMLEVEVKPGPNDLGKIVVSPDLFKD